MKTILLPTDFSPKNRPAVEHATGLVGDEPARFVLVHARPLPDSGTPLQLSALHGRSFRQASIRQRREFGYLCRTYGRADWTFTVETARCSLPFLLSRCVRDYAADLVVMQQPSKSWLAQYLPPLADSRLRIAARLGVPVLFVPNETSFTPPRQVAVFTPAADVADAARLRPLYEVATRYGSDVTGYKLTGKRPVRYELALERIDNGSTPPATRKEEPVDWTDLFDRSAPDLLVTTLPRQNPLGWLGQEQTAVRLAEQHGAPLLVL